MRVLLGLVLLCAFVCAQDEIAVHGFLVAPGQFVDLDTGTVLSRESVGDLAAEFRLVGAGGEFRLVPVGRTAARAGEGDEAPAHGFGTAPLELDRQERSWFVVTRSSNHARVEAQVGGPNPAGAVFLRVHVNAAGSRAFPEAPHALDASWSDGTLRVAWKAAPGRFLVTARAGKSRAEATVDGLDAALKGLAPGVLYRIEVRRIADDGLRSSPATGSFATGPRRIRDGAAHFKGRWWPSGAGLDVAGPRAFVEANPDILFYLYGAFAPGGLIHVGQGADAFRELRRLPASGYRPFYHRLDAGDVFAVRTKDGRYAKVLIEGDGGDYRNGMVARVTFLESGGFGLPARPGNPTWKRIGNRFEVQWSPARGAVGYQLWIAGAGELYKGAETKCVVEDLPANRAITMRVRAIYADGLRSEPTSFAVHTYPPRCRCGSFTLDCHGRNGWSFSDDAIVASAKGGEMFISNSAGGASSLRITGKHGIARPPRLVWGQLPNPGTLEWPGGEIHTDDREPLSQHFWVRSEEGGLASVRIASAAFPNVTFEYVYRPPLWPPEAAVLRDGKLVWKPVDEAESYVVRAGGHVLRTEATEVALPELKRNAFHRIELAAVLSDGTESGPYVVETDTYSDAYRRGRLDLGARSANGVSFTRGCVVPAGDELEFRLQQIAANRLRLIAPFGAVESHRLGFGQFPARGEKLDLAPQRDFAVEDLSNSVLLVRCADDALASVRPIVVDARTGKVRLRYVVRPNLTLEQALQCIAQAAPEPDAAAAQRAAALLERLGAADPRLRELAFAGLVRLGLKGARVVLAAREKSDDPEVRALLERWVLAVYTAELE